MPCLVKRQTQAAPPTPSTPACFGVHCSATMALQVFRADQHPFEVTTLTVDQVAWFKRREVAACLGYARPNDAIRVHVDEEDRKTYAALMEGAGATHVFRADEHPFEATTVTVDQVPWFKGREVAACLGYVNPQQTLRRNVDEEDRKTYGELIEGVLPTAPPSKHQPHDLCGAYGTSMSLASPSCSCLCLH